MRKFIFFVAIVGFAFWWGRDFVRSGGVEKFLDKHYRPDINAPIEYIWAAGLELAAHTDSCLYRYRRIVNKYSKTSYAPLAWASIINIYFNDGRRSLVEEESIKFLEAYPDHNKSEVVRQRVQYIRSTN